LFKTKSDCFLKFFKEIFLEHENHVEPIQIIHVVLTHKLRVEIMWTIIPVARRAEYMNALEQASCENNIVDFILFIKSLGKW